ncbi:hypothetical protein Zmor_002650 [Zophobas morio]|uniref:Uncharacterized protein n=1 Tax=Zophobas morio TaxID=2755281 RepID=A0AA38HK09_9CUCU|nr:hypothetical protein Zmor_002650 [Zophobas morio]
MSAELGFWWARQDWKDGREIYRGIKKVEYGVKQGDRPRRRWLNSVEEDLWRIDIRVWKKKLVRNSKESSGETVHLCIKVFLSN